MSVLSLASKPVRAVEVKERLDGWFASYCGDEWTDGFRTESGPLPLVMAALQDRAVRRGLPIIVFAGEVEF